MSETIAELLNKISRLELIKSSLEEENNQLLAKVDYLKATLYEQNKISFPFTWCLTIMEASIITELYNGYPAHRSKESLLTLAYSNKLDLPEIKIIDVFICKIRKKLRDCGIETCITTNWGTGYTLSQEAYDVIKTHNEGRYERATGKTSHRKDA